MNAGLTTRLRAALGILLELERTGSLMLAPWQVRVARLRVSQAHLYYWEARQVGRIILEHWRSGAVQEAIAWRETVNLSESLDRAERYIRNRAGRRSSGHWWCTFCNSGADVYYNHARGRLTALCSSRQCVRLIRPAPDDRRSPHFANIIPQDIGTYLVESMNPASLGTFYLVDALEQTCTCDDFRFRPLADHLCKHLLEVNFAVFTRRDF